jgi:hypothetical protein
MKGDLLEEVAQLEVQLPSGVGTPNRSTLSNPYPKSMPIGPSGEMTAALKPAP